MEYSPNNLLGMGLGEAVFTLAFQEFGNSTGDAVLAQMAAIDKLTHAPSEKQWDKGLLLGLQSPEPSVVNKTINAAVTRLKSLPDEESKERFLNAILDTCFLNLSGRMRTPILGSHGYNAEETQRLDRLESVSAELFSTVAKHLERHPLALEHHRSRCLSRARDIMHMAGRGMLADAVVKFQMQLAQGIRSDSQVSAQLQLKRKYEVYELSHSTDATLSAYLNLDASLPVEQVTEDLLQAYRYLLNYQSKELTRGAILLALENLTRWFSAVHPLQAVDRQLFLNDSIRAGWNTPWNDLSPCIRWQLWGHLQILPGPNHPEDLLNVIQTKYVSLEGEDVLIKAIGLLRQMPLVRFRTEDICGLVMQAHRLSRSKQVWEALLDLLETVLTGLADFTLSNEALTQKQKNRNLAMQKVLGQDQQIRKMLHTLSTDESLLLSNSAEEAEAVREKCWRVLLRCLPQNRMQLYHEGISKHRHKFIIATLEEAGQHHQREVWSLLQDNLPELIQGDISAEDRKRYLKAIADFFTRARIFEAVQSSPDSLGIMVALALDDPDVEIRQYVRQAVIASGYELELLCELQKRELIELRIGLSSSNEQVIQYEQDIAKLADNATTTQTKRTQHSLHVQELLGMRDIMATASLIATSELQVSLAEAREALAQALAEANVQTEILRGLQQRVSKLNKDCGRERDHIQSLVQDQQGHERRRDDLRRQSQQAERERSSAESDLDSAKRELSRLQSQSIPRPSGSSDPEEARRQNESYDEKSREHSRAIDREKGRISDLQNRISRCESSINSCASSIQAEEVAITKLQSQIDDARSRIRELESGANRLRSEFNAGRSDWQAIRNRIEWLSEQVRNLQQKFEREISRAQRNLDQNREGIIHEQTELERIHQHLASLSHQINHTGEQLDRQLTRSQALAQAIDSGRQHYDDIGGQAVSASAQADAVGVSLQSSSEQKILEEQEYKVQFAYGLNRALYSGPLCQDSLLPNLRG